MSEPGSITRITPDLHAEDPLLREAAARLIWLRYAPRLEAFVKNRLDPRILSRTDPSDVLQVAFQSFFAAPQSPDGPLRNRTELWRLLVHIVMCKLRNTANYHAAERRDFRREQSLGSDGTTSSSTDPRAVDLPDRAAQRPARELEGFEEFERLMAKLPRGLQKVLLLRLEGYTNAQIAEKIGRSERTVELKINKVRKLLEPHVQRYGWESIV